MTEPSAKDQYLVIVFWNEKRQPFSGKPAALGSVFEPKAHMSTIHTLSKTEIPGWKHALLQNIAAKAKVPDDLIATKSSAELYKIVQSHGFSLCFVPVHKIPRHGDGGKRLYASIHLDLTQAKGVPQVRKVFALHTNCIRAVRMASREALKYIRGEDGSAWPEDSTTTAEPPAKRAKVEPTDMFAQSLMAFSSASASITEKESKGEVFDADGYTSDGGLTKESQAQMDRRIREQDTYVRGNSKMPKRKANACSSRLSAVHTCIERYQQHMVVLRLTDSCDTKK